MYNIMHKQHIKSVESSKIIRVLVSTTVAITLTILFTPYSIYPFTVFQALRLNASEVVQKVYFYSSKHSHSMSKMIGIGNSSVKIFSGFSGTPVLR